ncbi:MAG: cation-translocating P-type ATPase [Cyanophyceae cyanobacterium]
MVEAIHTAVNGRARYKVKELYRSKSLEHYLERALGNQEGIINVSASSLTGNILVSFNPDRSAAEIAALIQESVSAFGQQGKQKSPRRIAATVADAEEQKTADWHLLELDTVLEILQTSQKQGLSSQDAAENLAKYGTNALAASPSRSDLSLLLEQLVTWPVALLGAAAAVSLVTGGVADALLIAGVVGINAVIGYTTETQSEKIIRSLQSEGPRTAVVIRDGDRLEVSTEAVTVGDLLVLQPNSYVAADGRLVEAENLSVDESALTGESIPVTKKTVSLSGAELSLADRSNMIYQGTFITVGQGLAVVVATGQLTELGKIQSLVSAAESIDTPLQKQLDQVGSQLVLLCGGVCALVFGVGLLRGYRLLPMLKSAISLAVASVPEGLPTIATTTLALGIQDMRQRNILIRGINVVEALGSIQTICLDKTGTITENKMIVEEVRLGSGTLKRADGQLRRTAINPDQDKELLKLIEIAVLCNDANITTKDGKNEVEGSATENALIELALVAGVDVVALRGKYPRLKTYSRTDSRNRMTTIHQRSRQLLVAVKGSPEEVLALCTSQLKAGTVVSLAEEERQTIELANERLAGQALRVLGVAYTTIQHLEAEPEELTWVGLTGMADPIREGVSELMAGFHQAGIKTVMITGDQSPTAYAIAKTLHLSRHHKLEILDASALAHLDPEKLQALCNRVDVFARISPADKLQIVRALQATGKIVAMTGDGINDTPALKAANVGIAMGSGNADIVREVADVIIKDDRLQTLIDAVSRGRTIYNNIRKSVHFLLSTNLSEIVVMTIATALGLGEPLNAMQLLWLNLVTDIFPGLALSLEPPEPDILAQAPRDPDEPIIKFSDFERIVFESGIISLGALSAYGYGLFKYGPGSQASTIAFMSLTGAQILHAMSCRSEHSLWARDPLPANPYLDGAIVGSLALQLLPLAVPGLGKILHLAPLAPGDWFIIALHAVLPLAINESAKE